MGRIEKLAIDGGKPVRTLPWPPWPYFGVDEVEAASAVLASGRVNYWTGTEGKAFEKEFAAFCGTRRAIALANGTVALELALEALGIGTGDEVIVPCRTFIATASAVARRGGIPVTADVDRDSQNITAKTIRPKITDRTRAVIVVHLNGWPCDMEPILKLARSRGFKVIEDCAQAVGARYRGTPVGALGDAGAFSFCQDKIMTTGGEGGMLVTNDEGLWKCAWSVKDHGKDYGKAVGDGPSTLFRWLHGSFGTNGRITEMQAAIGRKQLKKIDEWVGGRRRNAMILTKGLGEIAALRTPVPPKDSFHAYYKYYAFLQPARLKPGWDRERILTAIAAEGVPCYSGICPEIYREEAFSGAGLAPKRRFSTARELGETGLMFLVHPTLADQDMKDTVRAVKKVLAAAGK